MASLPSAPLRALQTRLLTLIESLPALAMHQPQAWDLSGPLHFLAQGYRVVFLDAGLAPLLAPFLDHSFETIKLINPRQPAVKITFYDKHKYWLLKNEQIPPTQRQQELDQYLQMLINQRQQLDQRRVGVDDSAAKIAPQQQAMALEQQIRQWQRVRDEPGAYELVISTYYSEYRYWYISWKYALDAVSFANATSHLLSPRRDRMGHILATKLNVVLVDTAAISQVHDHQHKQIAAYLAGFPLQSHGLKGQLFARPVEPAAPRDTGPDPKSTVTP